MLEFYVNLYSNQKKSLKKSPSMLLNMYTPIPVRKSVSHGGKETF